MPVNIAVFHRQRALPAANTLRAGESVLWALARQRACLASAGPEKTIPTRSQYSSDCTSRQHWVRKAQKVAGSGHAVRQTERQSLGEAVADIRTAVWLPSASTSRPRCDCNFPDSGY